LIVDTEANESTAHSHFESVLNEIDGPFTIGGNLGIHCASLYLPAPWPVVVPNGDDTARND
jgi:hypothetical protein